MIKRSWTHPISGGSVQPWNHLPKIREKVWHLKTIVHFDRNSYGVSGVSGSKMIQTYVDSTCHMSRFFGVDPCRSADPAGCSMATGCTFADAFGEWTSLPETLDFLRSTDGGSVAPRFRTWSHHLQCDHQRLSEVRPMAGGRGNQWGFPSMAIPQWLWMVYEMENHT